MSARAIVATIGYQIKREIEAEEYRNYTASCLRILTKNTAIPAAYYSNGEVGSYLDAEYNEPANHKPKKEYIRGEIADKIKEKLR